MRRRDDPIFVLDSGLGGLTVVRALLSRLPGERIVYFGDTARLPYGSKTKQTISHYVEQIIRWGQRFDPKHVVIACNTASALALPTVRRPFAPLAVSGVIDPGARAAAGSTSKADAIIGVIATEATVRSQAYQIAIQRRRHRARVLLRPTALLVPMIEEGRTNDDPLIDLALRQYLRPLIDRGIDALVLGCTHYPLLKPAIRKIVGDGVAVIDSAERCAEDVAARLENADVLAIANARDDRDRLSAFVTDDPERFARLAPRFLGFAVDPPALVSPETLYGLGEQQTPVRVSA